MNEAAIWTFAFGMLSVYPFFPLRHVPSIGRLKIPFWKLMLYATVIMLVQGFSYLWLSKLFPFGSPILAWHRKLFMVPYVLLTLCYSKDSASKTLFMDFFMVGIVMAVIDFAYVLDRTWFAAAFAAAPHRTDVLVRGAFTLLIYPPLYILFKRTLRPIMEIQSITVWRYMTAIPFVFAVISITTTMEAFGHVISPVILTIRFSIICGSVLVCALLGKVVRQMEQAVKQEEMRKQAEWLLDMQWAQYEALYRNIEQTREARHDLRHQLAAISAMVDGGEYDKLGAFVRQYSRSVSTDSDMVLCENYAANSTLNYYIARAHEEGISAVDVRCVLSPKNGVQDTDFCVLLGNLMENAIEGCKTLPVEERKIKLRMASHAGELLLTVDNTFDGVVATQDGEYLSRKRGGTQKGVGLSSVAALAEKYSGSLTCEQKNGWFLVSVSLPE